MRLYPKCGLEHSPGACVEHFEEAAVENDARGIALTRFDCELLAIGEGRQAFASGHETFCVIAAALSTVMRVHLAIRTVSSFFSSSFFSDPAIRRLPAKAFRRATRGAACATHGAVQRANAVMYRGPRGANRGLLAR